MAIKDTLHELLEQIDVVFIEGRPLYLSYSLEEHPCSTLIVFYMSNTLEVMSLKSIQISRILEMRSLEAHFVQLISLVT